MKAPPRRRKTRNGLSIYNEEHKSQWIIFRTSGNSLFLSILLLLFLLLLLVQLVAKSSKESIEWLLLRLALFVATVIKIQPPLLLVLCAGNSIFEASGRAL